MFSPPKCKFHELLKMAGIAVDDTVYQRPPIKAGRSEATLKC